MCIRDRSYTTYEYSLDKLDYNSDTDTFTATVTVNNTGDKDGKATVELPLFHTY